MAQTAYDRLISRIPAARRTAFALSLEVLLRDPDGPIAAIYDEVFARIDLQTEAYGKREDFLLNQLARVVHENRESIRTEVNKALTGQLWRRTLHNRLTNAGFAVAAITVGVFVLDSIVTASNHTLQTDLAANLKAQADMAIRTDTAIERLQQTVAAGQASADQRHRLDLEIVTNKMDINQAVGAALLRVGTLDGKAMTLTIPDATKRAGSQRLIQLNLTQDQQARLREAIDATESGAVEK